MRTGKLSFRQSKGLINIRTNLAMMFFAFDMYSIICTKGYAESATSRSTANRKTLASAPMIFPTESKLL